MKIKTHDGKQLFNAGELWDLLPPVKTPGNKIMFIFTGEKRAPRKGEYFISGAIPEAYKAPNDLSQVYHLARPVEVRKTEVFEIV